MKVEVLVKSVYGKKFFYPLSPEAETLVELLQTKTLTINQLQICEAAGWEVIVRTEEFSVKDFIKSDKKAKNQEFDDEDTE